MYQYMDHIPTDVDRGHNRTRDILLANRRAVSQKDRYYQCTHLPHEDIRCSSLKTMRSPDHMTDMHEHSADNYSRCEAYLNTGNTNSVVENNSAESNCRKDSGYMKDTSMMDVSIATYSIAQCTASRTPAAYTAADTAPATDRIGTACTTLYSYLHTKEARQSSWRLQISIQQPLPVYISWRALYTRNREWQVND
jgi:hypothetical protein